jgi:hypothetical protein
LFNEPRQSHKNNELVMSTHSDRIFQGRSTFPEHEEWYYRTREGIAGPYLRREDAAFALRCFIKYCQRNGLTGGREKPRSRPWLLAEAWSAMLREALPVATWALGALFGRISGG